MRRRTPLPSLRLLLTAVALLLGVLAMHVVSGGPHTPRAADHTMSSGLSAGASTAMDMGDAATTAVEGLPGALRDLAGRVERDLPEDFGVAVAVMCVAMLLSALVALGAGPPRRVRSDQQDQKCLLRVAARRGLTRAPPPDLLTRLCVLRT